MPADLWIASPCDMGEWMETSRLARAIGWRKVHAIGLLHCLWFHAAEHRPDGYVGDYSPQEIADVIPGYEGDADVLARALRDNGFIGQDGMLGMWDFLFTDHMEMLGRKADKMRKFRERKAAIPALYLWRRDCGLCRYCARPIKFAAMTVDHVVPLNQGGSNTDESNLATACRSCNSRKGSRTPDQARMVLLPIPNQSGIPLTSEMATGRMLAC